MTDEELDAGLVERLRDALPGTCRKERCRPPLNSGVRCPCADPVLRILGALPIPAAALNALAKGEAVVVSTEPTDAQEHIGGEVVDHPSVFMGGPSRQGRRTARQVYKAMIAASPYRSES